MFHSNAQIEPILIYMHTSCLQPHMISFLFVFSVFRLHNRIDPSVHPSVYQFLLLLHDVMFGVHGLVLYLVICDSVLYVVVFCYLLSCSLHVLAYMALFFSLLFVILYYTLLFFVIHCHFLLFFVIFCYSSLFFVIHYH